MIILVFFLFCFYLWIPWSGRCCRMLAHDDDESGKIKWEMFIKGNLKFLQIITPCIKRGRGWFMGAGAGAEHQKLFIFSSRYHSGLLTGSALFYTRTTSSVYCYYYYYWFISNYSRNIVQRNTRTGGREKEYERWINITSFSRYRFLNNRLCSIYFYL